MKICIDNMSKKAWVSTVGETATGNPKSIEVKLDYQSTIDLGLPRDYVRLNGVETVNIPDDTRLRAIQAVNYRAAIVDVDGNVLVPAYESKSSAKMYELVLSDEYKQALESLLKKKKDAGESV